MKKVFYKLLKWWGFQSFYLDVHCLVRNAKNGSSSGFALTFGLFRFTCMFGWCVEQIGEFPVHFTIALFERLTHQDALALFQVGGRFFSFSRFLRFGVIPARALRE